MSVRELEPLAQFCAVNRSTFFLACTMLLLLALSFVFVFGSACHTETDAAYYVCDNACAHASSETQHLNIRCFGEAPRPRETCGQFGLPSIFSVWLAARTCLHLFFFRRFCLDVETFVGYALDTGGVRFAL